MFAHGDTYNGQWQDDVMHGKGIMYYKDGSVYEGAWERGEVGSSCMHYGHMFIYINIYIYIWCRDLDVAGVVFFATGPALISKCISRISFNHTF